MNRQTHFHHRNIAQNRLSSRRQLGDGPLHSHFGALSPVVYRLCSVFEPEVVSRTYLVDDGVHGDAGLGTQDIVDLHEMLT